METFYIIAKNEDRKEELREKAEKAGFEYSESPDFVIAAGGDGTFLRSEREMPGVPKLLVRDSEVCYKCASESIEEVLAHIKRDEYSVKEHFKIECEGLVAVNDVVIRNRKPTRAIRFRVSIDGEAFNDVIIGDGIVVSTPFGSTGYYKSITGKDFKGGIGVAFNNPTEEVKPIRIPESSEVTFELVRGTAELAADNNKDIKEVGAGDSITIKKADSTARIIYH